MLFWLGLLPGVFLLSVNKKTEKTAPAGAIDQIGHVLIQLVHAFAETPNKAAIFQAKWDVQDGFW